MNLYDKMYTPTGNNFGKSVMNLPAAGSMSGGGGMDLKSLLPFLLGNMGGGQQQGQDMSALTETPGSDYQYQAQPQQGYSDLIRKALQVAKGF